MFLQICKSFELVPKGLLAKKDCFGKQSEEFEKEWKNGIDELDGTWRFVRNGFIVFLVFLEL